MTSDPSMRGTLSDEERVEAAALGRRLAGAMDDPDAFLQILEGGLAGLHDPTDAATLARVPPGPASHHAVPARLRGVIEQQLLATISTSSCSSSLNLAAHLERHRSRDVRLFALPLLARALGPEPERAWQSLRRLGRGAQDAIEVDALASVWAHGVLAEPFRWAELELLVYSAWAMERRLVGATLASIPERLPRPQRGDLRSHLQHHVLPTLGMLMGDAEDLVQEALSWAIREWTPVDRDATEVFLRDQAAIAREHVDGHRAQVLHDALSVQRPEVAEVIRSRMRGIRRVPGAPASSTAARQARAFAVDITGADDAVHSQGERFARSRA